MRRADAGEHSKTTHCGTTPLTGAARGLDPSLVGRHRWAYKAAGVLVTLIAVISCTVVWRLVVEPTRTAEKVVEEALGPAAAFEATKVFNSLYQAPPSANLGRHQLVCGTATLEGSVTIIAVLSRTGRRGRFHDPEIFVPERSSGVLYPDAGPFVINLCRTAAATA